MVESFPAVKKQDLMVRVPSDVADVHHVLALFLQKMVEVPNYDAG